MYKLFNVCDTILIINNSAWFVQLTFYLMLKNLLSIEPDDPIAENILEEFLTFMKGFVSLPVYFPGTAYSKALKVNLILATRICGFNSKSNIWYPKYLDLELILEFIFLSIPQFEYYINISLNSTI